MIKIQKEILQKKLNNNTKIVATLGPVTKDKKTILQLVENGVSIFRINFSHGSHESNGDIIKNVRAIEKETKIPLTIMQDLQGPKIRLGKIKDGKADLKLGAKFILTKNKVLGDSKRASLRSDVDFDDLEVGGEIYINDGLIQLEIIKILDKDIHTIVIDAGEISDARGVNFPDTKLSLPAITQKDRDDLFYGLKIGIDCVALSFVRNELEVRDLRELMGKKAVPIISKIEKWEAIENLEDIVQVSDGVMIARGDLGVELPIEEIPLMQKRIIKIAHKYRKPVITATQMLISMVSNPTPTRPEITDVSNAIFDGTDAVMLSNETATGNYPIKSVEVMYKIIKTTEQSKLFRNLMENRKYIIDSSETSAVARSAYEIAQTIKAKAIVCATELGRTAMMVSRHRPSMPVIALTSRQDTLRNLNLVWGVIPYKAPSQKSAENVFSFSAKLAKEMELSQTQGCIVVTAGSKPGMTGGTNLIKIQEF